MIDGPSGRPRRSWRERLELQHAVPDPDDWVSVVSARINDAETGSSRTVARAAKVLTDSGIQTEQRPHTLPDSGGYLRLPGAIPSPVERVRVAVLVRRRDWSAPKKYYAHT
ncbi:MAG: hypothetical protein ACLP8S_04495 [Solirubrobacteraceae bacterium]